MIAIYRWRITEQKFAPPPRAVGPNQIHLIYILGRFVFRFRLGCYLIFCLAWSKP